MPDPRSQPTEFELCWCGKRGFPSQEQAVQVAAITRGYAKARKRGREQDRRPMDAYECNWRRNGNGPTSGLWHVGHPSKTVTT